MHISYSPSAHFFYKLCTQSILHFSFQSLLFISHVFWTYGLPDFTFFVTLILSAFYCLQNDRNLWSTATTLVSQYSYGLSLSTPIYFLFYRIWNRLKGKPTKFKLIFLIKLQCHLFESLPLRSRGLDFQTFSK